MRDGQIGHGREANASSVGGSLDHGHYWPGSGVQGVQQEYQAMYRGRSVNCARPDAFERQPLAEDIRGAGHHNRTGAACQSFQCGFDPFRVERSIKGEKKWLQS